MAGHDDDMFDFFSQSQAHHEATSVDAAKYGFSQASSGRGGSEYTICREMVLVDLWLHEGVFCAMHVH
ncbi:Os09g0102000 [Oryza sativa Japonica Group]|uniref:Os09g0102000 protein n=1 Tax=Oryza sativa subsp. japonica TaxID=39947 RepID=C7J784_ORYSJ|nr:Os09g0102000 [Oryza sativa Japonica Group]|eukprot:NP_001175706.1 Os09g0102000 [Oryza sativa Japonica Group]